MEAASPCCARTRLPCGVASARRQPKELVQLLADRRVSAVPVVDDERQVVGIVSRADVPKVFLRPDEEIRREIVDEVILGELLMAPSRFQVDVCDGVVTSYGRNLWMSPWHEDAAYLPP